MIAGIWLPDKFSDQARRPAANLHPLPQRHRGEAGLFPTARHPEQIGRLFERALIATSNTGPLEFSVSFTFP